MRRYLQSHAQDELLKIYRREYKRRFTVPHFSFRMQNFMHAHRATKMYECRCMKFLCIISGCPEGARKWHIS